MGWKTEAKKRLAPVSKESKSNILNKIDTTKIDT
jgi:hypothetical protein